MITNEARATLGAYWPADRSEPVIDTTVGSVLRAAARNWPDAPGLVAGLPDPGARRRWTYAELLAEAERAARGLAGRFAPGERVAVWAPNLPEWVVLEFAAGLAGVVLVTVNPAYRPAELEYVLRQSGAAGIFLVPEFRSPMRAYLDEVLPSLPELREVIEFADWDSFVASGDPTVALPEVRPDDVAQIQYTSGTTGFPKGAQLTHRGITNNARFYAQRIELRPGEVYVNPMPLFHTAGCVMGALGSASSGAVHVPVHAFDPALVLDLIETERGAVVVGVPTMLIAMLEQFAASTRDLSSWRCAVSGGAPVPATLSQRVEREFGARMSIVFGTTECSPLLTQTRLDDSAADRCGTLGVPLPQTEVRISHPVTAAIVGIGEVGELCARGYLVMAGYHDRPDATARAIDGEGWYHTGDLASMDDRGYLCIEGRATDMIIRGGENIYPREIEDVLRTHPDVLDVAVVGVPDERWGETVAAFVRLQAGATEPGSELRALCRDRLAPYKTPTTWIFTDHFPLTASGKIQKFRLRERLSQPAVRNLHVNNAASTAEMT